MLLIQLAREDPSKLSRKFTMGDSLADIQFEVKRIQVARDEAQMVSMMSDGLKLGMGAFEIGVTKLRLASLTGWSEEAGNDMNQYKPALLKLYRKYWTKATVSPEAELAYALGSSLVKHQVSKRLNKALRPAVSSDSAGSRPPRYPAADTDSEDEDMPGAFSDDSDSGNDGIGSMKMPDLLQ